MEDIYDILIIGGGPAGITAGIYAKRAGKKVAILEKFVPGGQVSQLGEIENYTGVGKVVGFELAENFYNHAKALNVPFLFEEAVKYDFSDKIKKVYTKKHEYQAKVVVLAIGCKTRELNITGEQEFKGKGVSYCSVCDGNFFKGKNVAVIGSGDSAISDAIYLAGICNKVYVLTKYGFKPNNFKPDELEKFENVELLHHALSAEIKGKETVESLVYTQDEEVKEIKVDGVFVAIGRVADTEVFKGQIELGDRGYIKVDENMMTSADGVFACGDVVDGSIRQIVNATGDGAKVATKANLYLAGL